MIFLECNHRTELYTGFVGETLIYFFFWLYCTCLWTYVFIMLALKGLCQFLHKNNPLLSSCGHSKNNTLTLCPWCCNSRSSPVNTTKISAQKNTPRKSSLLSRAAIIIYSRLCVLKSSHPSSAKGGPRRLLHWGSPYSDPSCLPTMFRWCCCLLQWWVCVWQANALTSEQHQLRTACTFVVLIIWIYFHL